MNKIGPKNKKVLIGLLFASIVLYVAAMCFMVSELYYKVMRMEHKIMHLSGEHAGEVAH